MERSTYYSLARDHDFEPVSGRDIPHVFATQPGTLRSAILPGELPGFNAHYTVYSALC
jgi:hypothetical protein